MPTKIPLDSSPEHAAALGRLMGHWAIVESNLEMVLGVLLSVGQSRAKLVYQSFTSLSAKLDLLERLTNFHVQDSTGKTALLRLLSSAGELNAQRNALVHAIWAADGAGSLARIRTVLPGNTTKRLHAMRSFTAQDMRDVVDLMAALSDELVRFLMHESATLVISERPLR